MSDLIHTINRLENSKQRIDNYIDQNIVEWSEEEILRPTRKLAASWGLSSNAQNSITIEKGDFMKANMKWEYLGPDGEPLHEYLENGFDPHVIEAKGKMNGGADSLQWLDIAGKPVFYKKVFHPGFAGYHICRNGWNDNKDFLARRIVEEVKNYLETDRLG